MALIYHRKLEFQCDTAVQRKLNIEKKKKNVIVQIDEDH